MTEKLHEHGYLTVIAGSIYPSDRSCRFMIDNMAVILDRDTGSLIKYGDINNSDIKQYFETMYNKYKKAGFDEEADSLQLVSFDRYDGVLDIDEICTFVNYLMNHLGKERVDELFNMDADTIKMELAKIQTYGF